jgi:ribonuclease R
LSNQKKPAKPAPAKATRRSADPHLAREQEKYENPLPSREMILKVLEEEGVPVEEPRLAELLDIHEAEAEGFTRRIAAMERQGQVIRNRRGAILVAGKAGLIRGRVEGHPDGFGFLAPDDGSADLYLGPKEMHKALHGDTVLVRESGVDRRGRREGAIVEVLERANNKIVGRVFEEHGVAYVVAENRRISQDILIQPGQTLGARKGQVVVAEIVQYPDSHAEAIARIVEILGNYADPGMEIEIALRKHDLPHVFSRAAEAQAEKFPKEVPAKDLKGRKDLRDLDFVTIDGETARDFDDAVWCEHAPGKSGDFRLMVAIADVSQYVRPRDALDIESRERGNSVYFPRRVIPMLPEALSNELCSLKPDVDRLVMVCDMVISAGGAVKQYKFFPGVIHSSARLTYTQVAAVIEGKDPVVPVPAVVPERIAPLYGVFQALLKSRAKRGAIDFESMETQMIFNDQGKIERIVRVERNDAHRLIEECMLAANVCASDYLSSNQQATLYRVHEGPTPEKLEALRAMLKDFGLALGGGDEPQAKDYAALLARIKDRPYAGLLQTVMLRSLRQAVYSPENQGHFGLSYEAYAHFTSPIRRYPDLLVHRGIKAILKGEHYQGEDWGALGQHCSQTERRADEATRDVENWLKCFYMQDRVGEILPGTISGVTGFGLFVTLDDLFVDGLVHISDLSNDYYQFDAHKHSLVGERTGVRYQLGGRVNVKVVRVDLETSKIDFTLAAAVTKHEAFRPPLKGEAPPEPDLPPRRPPKGAGKPRDQQKKMAKVETRNRDGARQKRDAGKGKKKR